MTDPVPEPSPPAEVVDASSTGELTAAERLAIALGTATPGDRGVQDEPEHA